MDMIEITIFNIGIKAVGLYGQALAAMIAVLIVALIFRPRT